MTPLDLNKATVKKMFKEALVETLYEHRGLFREVLADALEEVGLTEAIRRSASPATPPSGLSTWASEHDDPQDFSGTSRDCPCAVVLPTAHQSGGEGTTGRRESARSEVRWACSLTA